MKTMYKINLFIFNYFHSKQGNVLISNGLGILYKGQSLNVKVKQGNIPIWDRIFDVTLTTNPIEKVFKEMKNSITVTCYSETAYNYVIAKFNWIHGR